MLMSAPGKGEIPLTRLERDRASCALFVVLDECCTVIEEAAATVARNTQSFGKSRMATLGIADCAFRLAAQLRCSKRQHAATVRRILMQMALASSWQENLRMRAAGG